VPSAVARSIASTDRLGADIESPTVGRLHHARPSAGYDDRMMFASAMICAPHETPEFASHIVVMTLGLDSLSNCRRRSSTLLGSAASDARSVSTLRSAAAGSQIRVLPKTTIV
jgi:hypothetical protein